MCLFQQTTDDRETPADGSTEEVERELSEDQIHDGYAIKPGKDV